MQKESLRRTLSLVLRVVGYLILFGIVRGILTFGDGWFGTIVGWILGLVATVFIISLLEVRGITGRLLDKLFQATIDNNTILPTTTVECPNCGNDCTITGSAGICPCCGSQVGKTG